jgi:quinol-cytochrome oxidoreductase complex cytochrome b subunit
MSLANQTQARGNGWRAWLAERFPLDVKIYEELAKEPIPRYMERWWFALGGTPLVLFGIQAVTGILMTWYYVPRPEVAYESVARITHNIPFGWWVRGIHHWGSYLMILSVVLHMIRTYTTGAYRKPREFNWIIGTGLLFVTLAFAFTGYALVNDQLSYWATTVGTNLLAEVPLVGPVILQMIRGGIAVTADTMTRLYPLHIGALPTAIVILIFLHIVLIRFHGVTDLDARERERLTRLGKPLPPPKPGVPERTHFPFFPDHVMTELVIALAVLVILVNLTILFPPDLGPQADPANTPAHIKPEWYFYPIFRWLKLVPLQVGIAGLIIGMALFVFWPFVDAFIERRTGQRDLNVYIGIIVAIGALGFILWELFSLT